MQFVLFRAMRTRHPLLRVLFTVLGIVIFGGLLLFGLFAAIALVSAGALFWLIRQFSQPRSRAVPGTRPPVPPASAPGGVLEGEFVVIGTEASRQTRPAD